MISAEIPRGPFPPFSIETATLKVRAAEDAWNSRDPVSVARAYTIDSEWRNRDSFLVGRDAIIALLTEKWAKEAEYRLVKDLWAFTDNRIAVRFQYECLTSGKWYRCYGNEQWEFADNGLMRRREASVNDRAITHEQRRFHWELGPRPNTHVGLIGVGS